MPCHLKSHAPVHVCMSIRNFKSLPAPFGFAFYRQPVQDTRRATRSKPQGRAPHLYHPFRIHTLLFSTPLVSLASPRAAFAITSSRRTGGGPLVLLFKLHHILKRPTRLQRSPATITTAPEFTPPFAAHVSAQILSGFSTSLAAPSARLKLTIHLSNHSSPCIITRVRLKKPHSMTLMILCRGVEAERRGLDELNAQYGSVVADVLVNVGCGTNVALGVRAISPVDVVQSATAVLVGDGVPELVASRLDTVPSEPPVVLLARDCVKI
ncbi:hypothetical protein IWX48DRAFT_464909 [Phyllosticta citricarpa]